ncbi:trypsin-like peptidase domain-containing protein [Microbacterium sp. ISL-103]|nr:trypsin-like peptidase domain-containing protein [Microbacterium sp. ISL-103]
MISDDGYVLTNPHGVTLGGAAADPTIRVTTADGRIFAATVVGTDPIYDLAVIKLTDASDLTPIDFADSSKLNVGDTAVALGAPLGLSNSVTTGIVSALNRSIQIASSALPDSSSEDAPQEEPQTPEEGEGEGPFQFDLPGNTAQQTSDTISIAVIQTDAAINHGNSGGALVNSKGELIGINVAIASSGSSEESGSIGIGFAIPSNIAQRVSDEIIADGAASHGLLGASVRDAASVEGAEVSGAYIAEVTGGGAAADAGLKADDIVTAFNGVPVTSASDLTAQVRAAAGGSDAKVNYIRGGKEYEADVTLGELAG